MIVAPSALPWSPWRVGQARWSIWFARHGIAPLRLTYENLITDPAAAVADIAALVDIANATIDRSKVSAGIMRDEMSDDWRCRYLSEAPSIDAFPRLTDWSPKALIDTVRTALR